MTLRDDCPADTVCLTVGEALRLEANLRKVELFFRRYATRCTEVVR